MKELFITLILISLCFFGNIADTGDLILPWNRVRIHVMSEEKTTASLIKGYMLVELRKIPDVSVVDKNEGFLITVLAKEYNDKIGLSICVLERFDNSCIKHYVKKKDWEDIIQQSTTDLYRHIHQMVHSFSYDDLERSMKDTIVLFNVEVLEKVRQQLK